MVRPYITLLLAVLACAGAGFAASRELGQPRDLHHARYVTAAQCARCHPDHSESFARTFHRTMTQRPNARSVRGDFTNGALDYFGAHATMDQQGDAYRIAYEVDGVAQTFQVAMTIGSRRYQQYVAQRGEELVRLPVAWHIEERRWFHMNGAFLTPDPSLPLRRADYERHVTRWNDNCVFCHNVAPNPGQSATGHFDTEVAEMGIACEACHGPGAEHERANTNPVRRHLLHLTGRADPSIVNPRRLSAERSLDVCGRCHGQRMTDDVARFLRSGDPFVPGDDLALYSAPLWRDSTLHDEPMFAARFWGDGTPRLTAYEYQGVLQSACARGGELSCLSCHGMHEGDPRGQIRPSKQGAAMCTQCHDTLQSETAQTQHARHPAPLPQCVDCHMPNIVYGVLDVHPSHRIELPDPARDQRSGRPDACTECHTDKSRSWAIEQRARLWGGDAQRIAPTPFSQVETQLFAGDPIERALSAQALGRAPTQRQKALLVDVLERDPYPAVRHFALRSLAEPVTMTPEQPLAERMRALAPLRQAFPLSQEDAAHVATLRPQAEALAIEIGE